jgi:hypothetical protein
MRKKVNCIGHILRSYCFLKHVIERKIEGRIDVTGRRRRRCKKLLDCLRKNTGYRKFEIEH